MENKKKTNYGKTGIFTLVQFSSFRSLKIVLVSCSNKKMCIFNTYILYQHFIDMIIFLENILSVYIPLINVGKCPTCLIIFFNLSMIILFVTNIKSF